MSYNHLVQYQYVNTSFCSFYRDVAGRPVSIQFDRLGVFCSHISIPAPWNTETRSALPISLHNLGCAYFLVPFIFSSSS